MTADRITAGLATAVIEHVRYFLSAVLVTVFVVVSVPSEAQTVYGQATITEDEGLHLSDHGRLHVYGNLDLHYDSNVNYAPAFLAVADFVQRSRLGLRLWVPSDRLDIRFGGFVDYWWYLGAFSPATRNLSTFQGAADLNLLANRDGAVTFYFNDTFIRSAGPANAIIGERLLFWKNFAQIGSDIRPGGRALEFGASFGFDLNWFDENQTSVISPQALTNYSFLPHVQALWRFFPKTAATLEGDGVITRYPLTSTAFTNAPLNAVKIRAGLIGLLTDKLSIILKAGWGNSFATVPDTAAEAVINNFDSVIGTAQVTWKPSDTVTFSGGYVRDFSPVSIFNWFSYDRFFVDYQHLLFGRFVLTLRAQYAYEIYGSPVPVDNIPVTSNRIDNFIQAEARFTYHIRNWVAMSAYYVPEWRLTNFFFGASPAQYARQVAGIDVTFAY